MGRKIDFRAQDLGSAVLPGSRCGALTLRPSCTLARSESVIGPLIQASPRPRTWSAPPRVAGPHVRKFSRNYQRVRFAADRLTSVGRTTSPPPRRRCDREHQGDDSLDARHAQTPPTLLESSAGRSHVVYEAYHAEGATAATPVLRAAPKGESTGRGATLGPAAACLRGPVPLLEKLPHGYAQGSTRGAGDEIGMIDPPLPAAEPWHRHGNQEFGQRLRRKGPTRLSGKSAAELLSHRVPAEVLDLQEPPSERTAVAAQANRARERRRRAPAGTAPSLAGFTDSHGLPAAEAPRTRLVALERRLG